MVEHSNDSTNLRWVCKFYKSALNTTSLLVHPCKQSKTKLTTICKQATIPCWQTHQQQTPDIFLISGFHNHVLINN